MQKMKQKSDFIGPICPNEYQAQELYIVFLKAVYKDWWVED